MKSIVGAFFIVFCCLNLSMGQRRSSTKETIVQAPSGNASGTNYTKSNVLKSSTKAPLESNPTSTLSFGISTTTNSGIFGGITIRKSWIKNPTVQSMISLDLSNTKDYREFDSPFSYNGRGFTEGKLNQLIVIRPEYARQWTLFKKPTEGGAALKGLIATGPSIGMQMPYFVDISYVNKSNGKSSIISIPLSQTLDNTYQRSVIIGESSFLKGVYQSTYVPGWHLKSALNIDLNTYKQNYLSLEMGFIIDYFSKPIEILNQTPHRSVYTTGYLTFFFGKSK